ncbi:hypothetical protein ABE504_25170 [Paenibacillus oryzisoli]|uniref:hypothetical protein n=1 Tax=Paenibacillus oryzisoli TaxID=1850517 RepID=UPI003D2C85DA
MDFIRQARIELLAYNALRTTGEELQAEMRDLDADIRGKAASLTGMPQARGGLPKSIVEKQAIYRESKLNLLSRRLKRVNRRIAAIDYAIGRLEPIERDVITRSFHSMDYESDGEIAESLSLTVDVLNDIKYRALRFIGIILETSRHKYRYEMASKAAGHFLRFRSP